MKKLVLVALMATSAFAFNGKGMVELNGCFDGQCDTLDFRTSSDDANFDDSTDAEEKSMNLALNYNYLFTNNFGAGLKYVMTDKTVDGDIETVGDTQNTIGLNFFWNFDGGWESTYAAFRYDMTTSDETETVGGGDDGQDATAMTLEFGKRMEMGKVFGMPVLYSPSVSYSMTKTESDVSGSDDREAASLVVNPVNFAVTF